MERRLDLSWRGAALACAAALLVALSAPAHAAPDPPIDGDLMPAEALPSPTPASPAALPAPAPAAPSSATVPTPGVDIAAPVPATDPATAAADSPTTYRKDDLIGAAEGVFGKGAAGLAGIIEDLLAKQGEPNGYIVGREGGGAIVVGLRYGSGTLHHKIEGEKPVYWTGPSIGFDAGANAGNAFVLVYNLFDTQDLYKRFGAGEGQAYLVGGFHVSYLRRGDIVLIPVRAGAGLRLGINAGYMKFSHKQNWLPF